ncbi:P-II family nitrogen regulator [Sphingomonas sp.]|jgi:hypothetical protein|uniref:P-II family nitrogen regulator n=1 Tax=Sphingomonas sp. TaxID=28214 RepID=UPI003BA8751E
MIETVERVRVEILVDQPLLRRVEQLAAEAGITGYTLLPLLGGHGASGPWRDDQLSGAQAKILFLTITSRTRAEQLTDALADLLDSHGLLLAISRVEVVRGAKFT